MIKRGGPSPSNAADGDDAGVRCRRSDNGRSMDFGIPTGRTRGDAPL